MYILIKSNRMLRESLFTLIKNRIGVTRGNTIYYNIETVLIYKPLFVVIVASTFRASQLMSRVLFVLHDF